MTHHLTINSSHTQTRWQVFNTVARACEEWWEAYEVRISLIFLYSMQIVSEESVATDETIFSSRLLLIICATYEYLLARSMASSNYY